MMITMVEPESIASEIGIQPGDELLEVNGKRILDGIDYRFHESDAVVSLKIAREREVTIYDIEKDEGERVGIDFEEMKTLSCGNDCIFCFVDQNPKGMRKQVYFRDGDYRLSFMYGNYTTMTNAGPAILQRIIEQRLSPQYISVHVTNYEVRKLLMGLKKDDRILEKIRQLHDNGIDIHTQIVLCPGINDGEILSKTITDLKKYHRHIISLAIVPVGLTDHRFGLFDLKKVDRKYANDLLDSVRQWQKQFRKEIGRAFVYPSDEFYIVAGQDLPSTRAYDGFPQTENGVGLVRSFINNFKKQSRRFPQSLEDKKKMTLVTSELPSGFMTTEILPRLSSIGNLEVEMVTAPNLLFGKSVTVAGLLSGKCVISSLQGKTLGELVLIPPDILNPEGLFLDDMTVRQLEEKLNRSVMVFDGRWQDVFASLLHPRERKHAQKLLPILNPS